MIALTFNCTLIKILSHRQQLFAGRSSKTHSLHSNSIPKKFQYPSFGHHGTTHSPQQRTREEDRHPSTPPRTACTSPIRSTAPSFSENADGLPLAHRRGARQHRPPLPPKHARPMVEPLPSEYELGQRLPRQTHSIAHHQKQA